MLSTRLSPHRQLDSGIDKQRSTYESDAVPSVPADCQQGLRELESNQRAFQELFRSVPSGDALAVRRRLCIGSGCLQCM